MSILEQFGLDESVFWLGYVGKCKHHIPGESANIRYQVDGSCWYCRKEQRARKKQRNADKAKARKELDQKLLIQYGINTEKFDLGPVCIHGHEWNGTGRGLRYRGSSCTGCSVARPGYLDRKPEDRFWEFVKKAGPDECWEWQGSINSTGYGNLGIEGKTVKAHRYSYELNKGAIPDGLHILHKCDNRKCVNPHHLWPGTDLENSQDKIAKGRANPPKGSRAGASKLTEADIPNIAALYDSGLSGNQIARKYSVSLPVILGILRGDFWQHVPRKTFHGPLMQRLNHRKNDGPIRWNIHETFAGIGRPPRPLVDRFWAKVDRKSSAECWHWQGRSNTNGYGTIGEGGKYGRMLMAHRVSYELHSGSIPNGLVVRHMCHNPSCVNPSHLLIGTVKQNAEDRDRRLQLSHFATGELN